MDLYTCTSEKLTGVDHHLHLILRGVARGGQRGQMPPLFSRKCDTCSLYYDRETNYFLLFSERSAVNIDSNDFDKACYKADILSTYFHDDRLNASEVGQSSICERIGRERPLQSHSSFQSSSLIGQFARKWSRERGVARV